ncbi:MAG TPA: PAS domain-containing protein [Firmicutes bacterium]|nr:PAS domain-containing protein [Bacillota bacterium]
MNRKIFYSILLASLIVLLASFTVIIGVMYDYSTGLLKRQMRLELGLAKSALESSGVAYLEGLDIDESSRVTWIASDGTVLFESDADPAEMDNHLGREEISEALAAGWGESSRWSSTLTEQTIYSAVRLDDGSVLRISNSRASVLSLLFGMLPPMALIFAGAFILSAILAGRMSKRVVEPLNRLDLDHPLENDAYPELSPLLNRINRQHQQITAQLLELRRRTEEFAQITGNMNEGLVLLGAKGEVISINPAAERLFMTDMSCVGQNFLTVDRTPELTQAISRATSTGHAELRCEREGREYQFDLSRIESDGKVTGTVLLAFDVTEQALAESRRREFTANVSHELKTPLQTIIGSAELIENGLVKSEDMPRFIGHIRFEATRLVRLIEDIIRLSQLDEEQEMPREDVNLYELCDEVVKSLEPTASARGIKLELVGGVCVINGVRRLLYEIVYNLCDNAIKYNVDNGSVTVTANPDSDGALLSVSDTGIGIPPEHQSRIFERFYRVDKSHSKQSGGTGLGLSIVKHAVKYHNAKLELVSAPGKGTTITVHFPAKENKADD